MKEIWKPINGYKNYQVSNMGNVKNIITGRVLKGQNNGKGYLFVTLYDENHKGKQIMIHRLIAQTFIPNPNNLPQVNHIDENKHNNCIENLEWITSEDNINHGTHNIRVGLNNPNRKPIYSVSENGEVIYYESGRDAKRYWMEKGIIVNPTGIVSVLKGKTDTYKNMAWYYQSDTSGITEYHKRFAYDGKRKWKKIYSLSDNNEVEYFDSMQSALKFYGLPKYQSTYLKSALDSGTKFNGLLWFYDNK